MGRWSIDTPVHEAVMQALGEASMCWEHPECAGVFDSEHAINIGEDLLTLLRAKLWTDEQ
jgi:hypothetical protein